MVRLALGLCVYALGRYLLKYLLFSGAAYSPPPLPGKRDWRAQCIANLKSKLRFLAAAIFGRHCRTRKRFHHSRNRPNDDMRPIDSSAPRRWVLTTWKVCKTKITSFPLSCYLYSLGSYSADVISRVPLRSLPHYISTHSCSEDVLPREATMQTSQHTQLR